MAKPIKSKPARMALHKKHGLKKLSKSLKKGKICTVKVTYHKDTIKSTVKVK